LQENADGVDMLYSTRDKYPWLEMQTIYPFSEEGVGNEDGEVHHRAVAGAGRTAQLLPV
jgi:hypothetical protein